MTNALAQCSRLTYYKERVLCPQKVQIAGVRVARVDLVRLDLLLGYEARNDGLRDLARSNEAELEVRVAEDLVWRRFARFAVFSAQL